MSALYFMFVCASFYCYVDASSAPFITRCHANDTACLKSSTQAALPVLAAGIPALGVSSMDPMLMQRVVASQAGLEMDFRNTLVKGLRNCVVENLKRKGHQTYMDLRCSVLLTGDYSLGGKLLILPVEGKGKYKIKIRDILVKIMFEIEQKSRDGQMYWHLPSWKHSAEVLTGAQYHFENLFNGNKQLSDTIHAFANSNWREIFKEVAPPIVEAIVANIVKEVQKFFDHVPVSELEL